MCHPVTQTDSDVWGFLKCFLFPVFLSTTPSPHSHDVSPQTSTRTQGPTRDTTKQTIAADTGRDGVIQGLWEHRKGATSEMGAFSPRKSGEASAGSSM